MKITIEVSDSRVEAFSRLGAIIGRDWKELFTEEVNRVEFDCEGDPLHFALMAGEYAQDTEDAGAIADRAISCIRARGGQAPSRESIVLNYQLVSGEISDEDYELCLTASLIIDGKRVPPPLLHDENEGEEWKEG